MESVSSENPASRRYQWLRAVLDSGIASEKPNGRWALAVAAHLFDAWSVERDSHWGVERIAQRVGDGSQDQRGVRRGLALLRERDFVRDNGTGPYGTTYRALWLPGDGPVNPRTWKGDENGTLSSQGGVSVQTGGGVSVQTGLGVSEESPKQSQENRVRGTESGEQSKEQGWEHNHQQSQEQDEEQSSQQIPQQRKEPNEEQSQDQRYSSERCICGDPWSHLAPKGQPPEPCPAVVEALAKMPSFDD